MGKKQGEKRKTIEGGKEKAVRGEEAPVQGHTRPGPIQRGSSPRLDGDSGKQGGKKRRKKEARKRKVEEAEKVKHTGGAPAGSRVPGEETESTGHKWREVDASSGRGKGDGPLGKRPR